MSSRWWLSGAVAALWGFPLAASAQLVEFGKATRIPDPPPPPTKVAIARDAADRMTAPVMVDGRGPYRFVVDTGADRTVISRELADTLGLSAGDPVRMNEVVGVDVTPTAHIDELAVGARLTRDIVAPTLAQTNLGAAGMLGIDSLRDQRLVLDFRHSLMTVEPSRRDRLGPDAIVVRAKSRYGQLVLVDAAINATPILVIVDSGAQNTIGNEALARMVLRDGVDRPGGEVVSVTGRSAQVHYAVLPNVRIGGFRIDNLGIAFADLHTFREFGMNDHPAMLLGMDVLSHFDRVVVDFGRKQVSFELPTPS